MIIVDLKNEKHITIGYTYTYIDIYIYVYYIMYIISYVYYTYSNVVFERARPCVFYYYFISIFFLFF